MDFLADYIAWYYYLLGIGAIFIAPICLLLLIAFKLINIPLSIKWLNRFFLVCSLSFFSFLTRLLVIMQSENFDLNPKGKFIFSASIFYLLSCTFFIFSVALNLKWLCDEFKKDNIKNRISISFALLLLIITFPFGGFLIFHLKRLIILSYGG